MLVAALLGSLDAALRESWRSLPVVFIASATAVMWVGHFVLFPGQGRRRLAETLAVQRRNFTRDGREDRPLRPRQHAASLHERERERQRRVRLMLAVLRLGARGGGQLKKSRLRPSAAGSASTSPRPWPGRRIRCA